MLDLRDLIKPLFTLIIIIIILCLRSTIHDYVHIINFLLLLNIIITTTVQSNPIPAGNTECTVLCDTNSLQ